MKREECLIPEHLFKYIDENINYGFVSENRKIYKEPGNDELEKYWYNECIVQDALNFDHQGNMDDWLIN